MASLTILDTKKFKVFDLHTIDVASVGSPSLFLDRISNAEERLMRLESILNDPIKRVKRNLYMKNVFGSSFITVPDDYYEWTLEKRALTLGARNISQLCKSIIFENTACEHYRYDDMTDSRYYCVIVQYEEMLRDLIHNLRPAEKRLPQKLFHFRLASERDNDQLSGFKHNGVSPFGMAANVPIVVCSRCIEVMPSYLFLGGGKVNVKLGIPTQELIRSTNAIVGKVSEPR